jgi:GNAT superfamily N-acetyltransferase
MRITLAELQISEADHQKFPIHAFDCADADLNEFLKVDCPKYKNYHLSHTKIALLNGHIVGFIALLADSISLVESERRWFIEKDIRVQQIPALKVGRLGVDYAFHRQGIGRALMQYSVAVAFRMNSNLGVGCRFLTVDAYPDSIAFYEHLGFVRSQHKTYRRSHHPNMHYDIIAGPEIQ